MSTQAPDYQARTRHTSLLLLGILIGTLAWSPPGAAQNRDRGPILLQLSSSTRALALGNSFALGYQDSDGIFYQPGLLNRVQGFSGSVQRFGSAATMTTLSAGRSWLSGGVALGIQALSYGAEGTRPLLGDDLLALPADIGSLRSKGTVGTSEVIVSVGYGRSVKGIRMGFVGKLVEERFGELKAATAGFDVGAARQAGPIALGLAVQNLGPDMAIGGEDIPLPLRLALGASSRRAPVGPLDLAASSAVIYNRDGDVVPSVGLEVAYWPVTGRTFVVRLGVRQLPEEQTGSPFTFGGAFIGDNILIDYAFEGFDSGSPSHRFSVGWR